MQIEEVLKSMTNVLAKDPACGFTQLHIDMCKESLTDYEKAVAGAGGDYNKIMKCVKKVVLGLNKADKKADSSLIRGAQRVPLIAFIREKAFAAGLKYTDEDITEYWSDW